MMPRLHRVGLHLRPMTMADAPAWFAYLSLPGAVEHTSWKLDGIEVLYPEIIASRPFDHDAPALFAIVDDLDELIGTVGFHTVWDAPRGGEIAYNLHPEHWGRGIASEACLAIADWGLDIRGYDYVEAYCLDVNLASQHVLEKCGFRRDELVRGLRIVQGRTRDFWRFRLTRDALETDAD
ncbi:GNAT family N-acetyltransferase [Lysobacter capsici]|jgi:ribosomal-protein-alanine N-acetyltransferase|uniref:Acetyltransferase, GNAT family n=1 Tax=Lysobacter capsici AZ78 TaxID=1444315 RepID=A0A120AH90_9GAMM|nr:GNAT family protein [Lysobacter capsici]KWS05795.1 acetyltransferase, GNAT family [Lysobacter capsici AZ78]UOF14748.1 GNAT family N-acetyltransferase [Lysobacter capsici]